LMFTAVHSIDIDPIVVISISGAPLTCQYSIK
jgi:hypothetical protein